ncbi:porin, partial [Caballeronia sp.]|uniref:porin n=1 Tax=Caballeronia sp. TaxID=1931223 RepID=UPI003C4ACF3B
MKKILVSAAVCGVFSIAAHAQSSVTLYGIVDAGLGYTSGQRVAQSSGAAGKPVVYTNASNY